jgi:hypothetical protein
MLEVQAGVAQEVERQMGMPSDARAAATKWCAKRVEGRRTHIGEFPAFEVAPDELDGVQLRCVAGQALDTQPRALLRQYRDIRALLCAASPSQIRMTGWRQKCRLRSRRKAINVRSV